MAKDKAAWDKLVDDLFELDKAHPYLGQTVEPDDQKKAEEPAERKEPDPKP